ncbi:putative ABC transporter ATP-binding protein YheS [Botrimarina colliarenosi]|uniref:Putative ABC transporter ATP-binding protein YheS n=1 Tax=Botrimarina colliarenosi TaxID=2528001 RepID=A0A5C6AIK8_9BACT|nr:ABC-F family ATP-binding cassette domain-containing protein [Botrimarina colliarenosi]TWT99844.1 putative ABC transporter ATP-binding protein YheS [Botrimarina colliarenosi]
MPVVLSLQDAHKRYGHQVLLDGAACALTDDQKVGLIGRNGAGKSTLCRILLGDEDLDAGDVVRSKKLRLGYLRQHDPFRDGETGMEFLQRDSGQPDWKCGQVAWRFALGDDMLLRPVRELSGGWQTRVKLAALLLHDPNLLILDEPTNFLDLRTQILLEHFLKDFKAGVLVVSHDRSFLGATCNHTLELTRGSLTMFPGDVESYLTNLEERREHDRRLNTATATKRKQLEQFIASNRANANTASQARSKAKQLEKLEMIEVAGEEARVHFSFPAVEARKGPAMRAENLTIGYEDRDIASDIQLEIEHGERVGIVGDNGQGKTTFLRTICESLPVKEGQMKWGFGCQLGVYAQHVYTTLRPDQSVLEYLEYQATPGTTTQQIKTIAGSFLFSGETAEKKIKVLSGGERARLVLAGLLLEKHNVLVLDEPGNHLDVETVEALAEALKRYVGTVIFTSHDRHFMHEVATSVIEVGGGRVVAYPSSYDDYVYRIGKEIDAGLRVAPGVKAKDAAADDSSNSPKPGGKADRDAQKRLKAVERRIAKLDDEKKQLNEELTKAATDVDKIKKLQTQLAEIVDECETLEAEWLELSEATGAW